MLVDPTQGRSEVPQRKTALSDKSRELIERSYRVRERLRKTLEEARRLARQRDSAQARQRAREVGEDREVRVEPNPVQTEDRVRR
jgi:hypothetical protein